jgi:RNA polymerase sigma-70 factor (ECF subfamily)
LKASDTIAQLYADHGKMVFNIALNHLQQWEEAEEVTQDVFVKVHAKLAGFSGRSSIRTWIFRITVNQCLDRLKARKRQKRAGFHLRFFGEEERDPAAALPDYDHPGVLLEDREAVHSLFTLIDTLPPRQRSILILKAVDGLEQQEIAAILGLSVKAVESLLSRAKANLKQKMMDSEGRPPGTSSKQPSS